MMTFLAPLIISAILTLFDTTYNLTLLSYNLSYKYYHRRYISVLKTLENRRAWNLEENWSRRLLWETSWDITHKYCDYLNKRGCLLLRTIVQVKGHDIQTRSIHLGHLSLKVNTVQFYNNSSNFFYLDFHYISVDTF